MCLTLKKFPLSDRQLEIFNEMLQKACFEPNEQIRCLFGIAKRSKNNYGSVVDEFCKLLHTITSQWSVTDCRILTIYMYNAVFLVECWFRFCAHTFLHSAKHWLLHLFYPSVQVYPVCLRVNDSLAFVLFITSVFQFFSILRNWKNKVNPHAMYRRLVPLICALPYCLVKRVMPSFARN